MWTQGKTSFKMQNTMGGVGRGGVISAFLVHAGRWSSEEQDLDLDVDPFPCRVEPRRTCAGCRRQEEVPAGAHSDEMGTACGCALNSGPSPVSYLPTEDVIQDLSHNHYRYPFQFNLISGSIIFWRVIV